jgi:hypothetical protein
VAVRKNVRADRDALAHAPLDWKAAAIDLRPHALDDDAAAGSDLERLRSACIGFVWSNPESRIPNPGLHVSE